jgi:tetratricopeptide (TPR) repeat protein
MILQLSPEYQSKPEKSMSCQECNRNIELVARMIILTFIMLITSIAWGEEGPAELLSKASRLMAAKEYSRAVRVYKETLQLDPASAAAHEGMGWALMALGDREGVVNMETLDNAALSFANALRIKPDLASAHYGRALALLGLGDQGGAEKELKALVPLDLGLANKLGEKLHDYKPAPAFREVSTIGRDSGSCTKVVIKGNTVLVPVTLVNRGRTAQAHLVLDTGASVTVINNGLAQQLGMDLRGAYKGRVQVVGGGTVEASGARLESLIVGPHTKRNMLIAVIDQNGPFMKLDGLLGMDFLRGHRYQVNFLTSTLEWQ